MMKKEISLEFEEWRENFVHEDGRVSFNVLFVGARYGSIWYHTPVWDEEMATDAKMILALKVKERLDN